MTENTPQHQPTDLSVVNRLIVIVPKFSCWTGTRAMHEGDYNVGADGSLPPREVAKSLGYKAIIDPQELLVFNRLKSRAEGFLENTGVRFLSGWGVPADRSSEVFTKLDALIREYEKEKADFLNRYESLVDAWANQNPEYAREIREGKLDSADVAMRITAQYDSFRLSPATPDRAADLAESVEGLSNDLIRSVAQMARSFFKKSFMGKDRASQRTIQTIRKIREKLNGLSFLSTRIVPLIVLIDDVLVKLPTEGYFSGESFWQLATLVRTLGDESLLKSVIDGSLSDGSSVTGIYESVTQKSEPDLFKDADTVLKVAEDVLEPEAERPPCLDEKKEDVKEAGGNSIAVAPLVELPAVEVGEGFYF